MILTSSVLENSHAISPMPTVAGLPHCYSGGTDAEQLLERHRRRNIPYRWIVRHHAGEERSLPTSPTSPLKTHGRVSGSVTTMVTLQASQPWSPSRCGAHHSIVRAAPRRCTYKI